MTRAPSATVEAYILEDWPFEDGRNWNALELADVIEKWARPGNWLDLGCGPMLSVWPMFANFKANVWGCDRNPEIALFHEALKFRPLSEWPVGLVQAVEFYNRRVAPKSGVYRSKTMIDEVNGVVTASVLDNQHLWHNFFDTVIQVGSLACLESLTELKMALTHVRTYLRPNGRFISVTWLSRPGYEESEVWGGANLTSLPAKLFASMVEHAGLSICDFRIAEVDDPNHYQRYVIVAEKS